MSDVAAFTIVQDETVMLPVWWRYYQSHFPGHCYILDHESRGAISEIPEDCLRRIRHPQSHSFDHTWLVEQVEAFQRELLRQYEVVVFTEVDEFLVHRTRPLGAYAAKQTFPVRAVGYNVLHRGEPPMRWDEPILAQRTWWCRSIWYDKTLISPIPLQWERGFHRAVPPGGHDPDLFLVHLHRADRATAHARHEARHARIWSPGDVAVGAGRQSAWLDGSPEFETFMASFQDTAAPTEIPDDIRPLL